MCLLVLSVFAAVTLCATGLQDGYAVLARRSPQQSCDVRYAVKHRMAVEISQPVAGCRLYRVKCSKQA